jgi:hypothetical protein
MLGLAGGGGSTDDLPRAVAASGRVGDRATVHATVWSVHCRRVSVWRVFDSIIGA